MLGAFHARTALSQGWEVVHLEREEAARGVSVRNFGLIWVSGRAVGPELDLALEARARWEAAAIYCPAMGFRPNGSLTAVCHPAEVSVLEAVMARPDADARGLSLVEPAEALRRNPSLGGARRGGPVLAALHCRLDATVEPRRALGALRQAALASGRYRWLAGRAAVSVGDHEVTDDTGERHRGDLVVLCTGATHTGLAGEVLHGAPVRRVRLQMLETASFAGDLTTSVADGDSLRYYPSFDVPERTALSAQDPLAATWASQLLMVQRLDGALTVGDTHSYDEPFAFDLDEAPYSHLTAAGERLLGSTSAPGGATVGRRLQPAHCVRGRRPLPAAPRWPQGPCSSPGPAGAA